MTTEEEGRDRDWALTAEGIIQRLRQKAASPAVCWIVCYEDRPLQGTPPGGSGPHLLLFSSPERANGFIAGRRRYFEPEPLSVVAVDSVERLKELASTPARDSRYTPPPLGLLLDFAYASGKSAAVVSPEESAVSDAEALAKKLGVAAPVAQGPPGPVRCMICHKPLNYERKVSGIFFGDQFQEQVERIAYRCRRCGEPICMSCAYTSVCTSCGGDVFDRALGEELPGTAPSAPAREAPAEAAVPKEPQAAPPEAVPSPPPAAPPVPHRPQAATPEAVPGPPPAARLPEALAGPAPLAATSASRARLPRWAWAVGAALLIAALVVLAILVTRGRGTSRIPGIDSALKVQDGSIQVLGVERTDAVTLAGQTATAHIGYDILLVEVRVKGIVPLACVGTMEGCRPLLMGHWDLVDSGGERYAVVGLYQGKLIFEVRESARGLVLWLGDEVSIPLARLLGEQGTPAAGAGVEVAASPVSAIPRTAPALTAQVERPIEVTEPPQILTVEPLASLACPDFELVTGAWTGFATFLVSRDRTRLEDLTFEFPGTCPATVTIAELPIQDCEIEFNATEGDARISGQARFVSPNEISGSVTLVTSLCASSSDWRSFASGAPEAVSPGSREAPTASPVPATPAISLPEPGDWRATAEFGTIAFGVGADGAVDQALGFDFSTFACGGLSVSGLLAGWCDLTEPAAPGSFEAACSFPTFGMTVRGTFDPAGKQATGTWEAKAGGTVCSGAWEAAPAAASLPTPEAPTPTAAGAEVLPPPLQPFSCPAARVDDFSSDRGLGTGSADFARWGVTSGEYYLAMKAPDSWVWRSDGVQQSDALIEVDIREAKAGSGAYGLAFGGAGLVDGQELYAFVLAPGGYFGLYRHNQAGAWHEIQPFTYSFILVQGSETNHLRVVRRGPLIALYANGIPLASTYSDATYTGPRIAGVIAWSDSTAGLEARFDDLKICSLTEAYPLPITPFAQKTVRWPADQPAVLNWTWFATTAALAQSFADQADVTLTLDGRSFYGLGEYWSTPTPYPSGYAVQWNLPLPALEPGVHRIETTISLSAQVTDGFDENQDGRQDLYGPGEVAGGWVELNVED